MKALATSKAILICLWLGCGCSTHYSEISTLSENERLALRNYEAEGYYSVENAARICLVHGLTKTEVIQLLGTKMRSQIADRSVSYYWMPGNILTFNFDDAGDIETVDLGYKQFTRNDFK